MEISSITNLLAQTNFRKINKDARTNYFYNLQKTECKKLKIKQVTLQEFLAAISHSKNCRLLLDNLKNINEQALFQNAKHGLPHNVRTSLLGFYIAEQLGWTRRDLQLLLFGTMYHDIGRTSDHEDKCHGAQSAKKLANMKLGLPAQDLAILKAIVTAHCLPDEQFDSILEANKIKDTDRAKLMFMVLKDADALDRTRLDYPYIQLSMLRTSVSSALIDVAYELEANLQSEDLKNGDRKNYERFVHDNFTGKAQKALLEQIEKFYALDKFNLKRNTYKIGQEVSLNKNNLVCGGNASLNSIEKFAKEGLICLTNDFANQIVAFKFDKKVALQKYVKDYSGMTVVYGDNYELIPYGGLDKFVERFDDKACTSWQAESTREMRYLPNLAKDNEKVGYILNISSKECETLFNTEMPTQLSANTVKNKFEQNFEARTTKVMFGLPKSCIEGLIVDKALCKKEYLNTLKTLFPACYICDINGKVLAE